MRKAIHTRQVTFSLTDLDFKRVKEITDREEISFAEWFRAATTMKLEHDAKEDSENE